MSQVSEDAIRLAFASMRKQLATEITEAVEKAMREKRGILVAWRIARAVETGGEHRREEEV